MSNSEVKVILCLLSIAVRSKLNGETSRVVKNKVTAC